MATTFAGYTFSQPDLFSTATTHRSYRNETVQCSADYERLEFLGDAILSAVVADILYKQHPHASEGDLSKMRASLTNEATLAKVAGKLDLGQHLQLGRGEINGVKPAILADALEAVIAAVFLDGDGDFTAASTWIERWFLDDLASVAPDVDFKAQLQQLAGTNPVYEVVDVTGPDHAKAFTVTVSILGTAAGTGTGTTKKSAGQQAAGEALQKQASWSKAAE